MHKGFTIIVGEQYVGELVGEQTLGQLAEIKLDSVGHVEHGELVGVEAERLALVNELFESIDARLDAILAEDAHFLLRYATYKLHRLQHLTGQRLTGALHDRAQRHAEHGLIERLALIRRQLHATLAHLMLADLLGSRRGGRGACRIRARFVLLHAVPRRGHVRFFIDKLVFKLFESGLGLEAPLSARIQVRGGGMLANSCS